MRWHGTWRPLIDQRQFLRRQELSAPGDRRKPGRHARPWPPLRNALAWLLSGVIIVAVICIAAR